MLKRIIILLVTALLIGLSIAGYLAWKYVYKSNVDLTEDQISFYIQTGNNYEDVLDNLDSLEIIDNRNTFDWVAKKMNFPSHIYPGRYIIRNGLNNRTLIKLLRSGKQTPVKITFNNIRTRPQLAGVLANQVEPDSTPIAEKMLNAEYAQKFGFNIDNFGCMFLPNTYEVYWDIDTEKIFNRFYSEYNRFWTEQKKQKAKSLELSPIEISILASIVEKETSVMEEYSTIAGVYLNRLNKRMPLQADPTIIFAHKDFSIKRVLHKHLEIDSPYNTYKYRGLPPGPICIPSIQAINSVLNNKSHNYLYFCAKDDFSGRHVFAKTLRQHNQNARMYRKALNKRKIYN